MPPDPALSTSRGGAVSSAPQVVRPISTARFVVFVVFVVFVTIACVAWYREVFIVATPVLGVVGLLLWPRRELTRNVGRRDVLAIAIGIPVLVAVIAALGWLASFVDGARWEAIGSHPATIAVVWVVLLYMGARKWRRQLVRC
jgi:hypothetical protein